MYFYIHKIYKHENEQAHLLEMCNNACFCFRDGKDGDSIINQFYFI
jgi:hypothetical protein